MRDPESLQTLVKEKPKKGRGQSSFRGSATPSELPFLATVERLVHDRGFGFVACDSVEGEYLFHYQGDVSGRSDLSGVSEGDRLVCQLAITPHSPGQQRVVQWSRVDDLDWDPNPPPGSQQELDDLRCESLRKRSLDDLTSRLSAGWFARLWNGKAPTDLCDPVLAEIWCEKLSQLDLHALRKACILATLKSCLYDFGAKLDPANSNCSFQVLTAVFTTSQLAVLGEPQHAWLCHADEQQKAILLEWFLLSSAERTPKDGYKDWLTATSKYEADVAERFLERGEPLLGAARHWAFNLATKGLLSQAHTDRLAIADLPAAGVLFERLSSEARGEVVSAWMRNPDVLSRVLNDRPRLLSELVRPGALAIDLETDGERIWEIGCCDGDGAARLHDENGGTEVAVALTDLSARVSNASIVVGHNVLAWDWPILAPRLALPSEPLIWDTLLVQFLVEPQAASHALGGSHHAEDDASAALTLFLQQLGRLPSSFAVRFLAGEFRSATALLNAISEALIGAGSLARAAPQILQDPGYAPPRMLLLPESSIACVDWVPGVAVVQANPLQRLPSSLWQIEVALLETVIAGELLQNPFAQALLAVARRACAEGIALRRAMLPVWLVERYPDLSAAIDLSCVTPSSGEQICVSLLPDSWNWWAQADGGAVRAALPDGPALIVDREEASEDAVAFEGMYPPPLMRSCDEAEDWWVIQDRSAHALDSRGGWRRFRTVVVPGSVVIDALSPSVLANQPVVFTRQKKALYPGSNDQATYWTGVLQAFCQVTIGVGDVVPVLLVGSTSSRAMMDKLSTALAEIGMGEVCPSYRSRREHLKRAAKHRFAIVDLVDRWRDWQSIAAEICVALQPVLEALPLEEWYALANAATPIDAVGGFQGAKVVSDDDVETSDDADDEAEASDDDAGDADVEAEDVDELVHSAPMALKAPAAFIHVSGARLLEELPGLVGRFFPRWLERTGLGQSALEVMILDPRAGAASQQLRSFASSRPLAGPPLSTEQLTQLEVAFFALQVKREEAPSDYGSMEAFLVKHWQPPVGSDGNEVKEFKASQKRPIEAICPRLNDVMVALPTGEGKSVLFQVPALCRGLRNRRLTLVLSPLKALMRDQVGRLHDQRFAESVDYLSSDLTRLEIEEILQGVLDHRIVLLYVAPERLRSGVFVDVLTRRIKSDRGLEYVVFDEAHCVNQWGYEFRPDYFYAFDYLLRRLRGGEFLDKTPFLLLSATITASDHRFLSGLLDQGSVEGAKLSLTCIPDPKNFTNPLREHIQVKPENVPGNLLQRKDYDKAIEKRLPHLVGAISEARQNREKTGQRSAVIIFVSRRAHAEDIARRLAEAVECDVDYYHAGLDAGSREDIYSRFREGNLDVLVATKAFGMGMDIPDIHWVVHISSPTYLEDYLQEVGRIGRGEKERKKAGLDDLSAVLLSSASDFENVRSLRAKYALTAQEIADIEEKLVAHIQEVDCQKIVVVPQHGYDPFKSAAEMRSNATRLRMSLYWLEKAKHLRQIGTIADLIKVELAPSVLLEIGKEQSIVGAVARAVLSLVDDRPSAQIQSDGSCKCLSLARIVSAGFVQTNGTGSAL